MLGILGCLLLLVVAPAALYSQESLPKQAQAILQKNCVSCHGAAMKMSGLDLRTQRSVQAGGTRGPSVEPGNPQRSLLYRLITHEVKPTMPPGQKLSDADLAVLRRWIIAGAILEDPAEGASDEKVRLAKLEERPITAEDRNFWAYQPPVRQDPPPGAEHPVDAFLARLKGAKGLTPSPRADARTLIRRAYLDLVGLPPSPGEVEAFAADPSDEHWKRVIETLLASPHYGERWGRHWLDLVRYADSGGFERDFDWNNAWRYRDYVINAFNSDKPYDQFIREQISGDEIDNSSDEAMIATGYLRLGLDNNIKNERTRMDELDDLVATTSLAFLGQTVGCARCHNHKFDPISQKDYYRMQAVFFSTKGVEYPLVLPEVVARHEAETKRIREAQKPLKDEKNQLEEPYRRRIFDERISRLPEYLQAAWRTPKEQRTQGQQLNAEQIEKTLIIKAPEIVARMTENERKRHEELVREIEDLDKKKPEQYATARAIGEEGRDPLPSYFLHRGAPDMKGSLMQPGILTVAWNREYEFPLSPPPAKSSWRRRAFAEWIASKENPLTARVMVNRIWQHHFGEGIVRTPSNFGTTGQPPSAPELLDWLATEFVRSGWSVKSMHRLMMTSETYRMTSDDIAHNVALDPENRFFWRMPRQRLQAEILRDQMLAVAGTLDRTVGGPGVFPFIDPDLFQSSTQRTWPGKPDTDTSTWRRSIYVFMKRSIRYPMFEAFDQPDATLSCDRRNRSTVAPQALLLMNNASVVLQAGKFAERLQREAGVDPARQVDLAYRLALSRRSTAFESDRGVEFLVNKAGTLADFCQLIFNLNEFAYRQ
jgi:cytochrome c551/c552